MLYITVALSAEARPLIEYFELTRTYVLPYTLFENESLKLIVTGMGIDNAMMATSALLGHFPPKQGDLLINVGICAAPKEFAIAQALLAHKLTYKEHSCYPDILFEHTLHECELLCVDEPVHTPLKDPADMESYAVYKAASRFLDTQSILFFKVVSDHFEPLHVNKTDVEKLISSNLPQLLNIIHSAQYVNAQEELFDADEKELMDAIAQHLTKSQSHAFYDACAYHKLHKKTALHVNIPDKKLSKHERNSYFEQLIKTLTL
jgi:hypothetical protein